jgi:hypothetical protein
VIQNPAAESIRKEVEKYSRWKAIAVMHQAVFEPTFPVFKRSETVWNLDPAVAVTVSSFKLSESCLCYSEDYMFVRRLGTKYEKGSWKLAGRPVTRLFRKRYSNA